MKISKEFLDGHIKPKTFNKNPEIIGEHLSSSSEEDELKKLEEEAK